jgi:hypothetical protein
MASLSLVDGKWVLAADTVAWIDADLSEFTRSDTNGIYDAGSSTLGVTSTIALDGSVHGRIGSGVPDGLFFTLQLTDFDRTKHYAVAIRATWGNTLTGTWEMYLGMGNDSTPVSDGGVYLSTQLDSSAAVGGNDYGTLPSNNQIVTDARYLGGVINYRSDRQDGSVGQNADADRLARGGQNRSVDPGTPMTDNDQYLMVGFGNQNTTDTQTLTNLKVQYQLLTHYGLDT